eukprot:gene12949-5988_t
MLLLWDSDSWLKFSSSVSAPAGSRSAKQGQEARGASPAEKSNSGSLALTTAAHALGVGDDGGADKCGDGGAGGGAENKHASAGLQTTAGDLHSSETAAAAGGGGAGAGAGGADAGSIGGAGIGGAGAAAVLTAFHPAPAHAPTSSVLPPSRGGHIHRKSGVLHSTFNQSAELAGGPEQGSPGPPGQDGGYAAAAITLQLLTQLYQQLSELAEDDELDLLIGSVLRAVLVLLPVQTSRESLEVLDQLRHSTQPSTAGGVRTCMAYVCPTCGLGLAQALRP